MTTNQVVARSEVVRQRRTKSVPQIPPQKIKRDYRPEAIQSPVKPKPKTTGRIIQSRPQAYNTNQRHYDIAFNTSRASIRTPGITLPALGPRLVSSILIVVMGFVLLTLWNSSIFQVTGAQVSGNLRLTEADINSVLQIIGEPIFSTVPEKIEQDLIHDYPDIASVDVKISLPNQVMVNITERIPVIAWQSKDGSVNWIDAQGYKFPARGQAENLVTVSADGEPPTYYVEATDPTNTSDTALASATTPIVFIQPSMIKTITDLISIAPQGVTITYDSNYGLGWDDPRGWKVYLGDNTQDVSMKLTVYQAIIDKLTQEGVQPKMINVEYLDAPFYRTQ